MSNLLDHIDTSEKDFQELMTKELVKLHGYVENTSNDFDREFCLNVSQLMSSFKRHSQFPMMRFRRGANGPFLLA
ncbi:MAG: hypothetical protein AAFX57_10745 [Bacteroidota bacterium]